MSYESFKEDLSPEEINMLDDCLNLSYEHPARSDFLHLARLLDHLYRQRIYDDPDISEDVLNPLMELTSALFMDELIEWHESGVPFEPEWDDDGVLLDDDEDEDESQLELDWDDYEFESDDSET